MKRRLFTTGLFAAGLMTPGVVLTGRALALPQRGLSGGEAAKQGGSGPEMTVFRSPTCGCCGQWVEHVEAAGFSVQNHLSDDMQAVKQQYGVPSDLASCHTAIVDGYVIEGHVPAADIQRLLAEKPEVAGIAVPGMPVGSPGMESGDRVDPYTVFSFTEQGETAAFAQHS